MRKTLALMAIVLTVGLTAGLDAEAKRLGGGRSSGMQRQGVAAPANNGATPATPAQNAPAAGAPATAPAAAAAAAPKRSWMGPIAGLAAGLGLAALASHLGFGEALANMMMIGLLVMAVLLVIGVVMRKRAAAQGGALAGAGGVGAMGSGTLRGGPGQPVFRGTSAPGAGSLIGSGIGGGLSSPAASTGTTGTIPAGFDKAGFERTARDQFMALQAANDARDLDRLRDYLSTELFESARADIAARGDATQKTEVFGLEAQVLDVTEDGERYIASVRFTGSIREQFGAQPDDLHEVWHLAKPKSGFGGWVIAGIQQAE